MVVANWPSACPKCGCREFDFRRVRAGSVVLRDGQPADRVTAGFSARFECIDRSCGHEWTQPLLVADLSVASPVAPMAVAAPTAEAADLLALPERWKIASLAEALAAGAARVDAVMRAAEAAARVAGAVDAVRP